MLFLMNCDYVQCHDSRERVSSYVENGGIKVHKFFAICFVYNFWVCARERYYNINIETSLKTKRRPLDRMDLDT